MIGCACPVCHRVFRVPGPARGREVRCPACHELVRIPAVSEAAGAPGRRPYRRIGEDAGSRDGASGAGQRIRKKKEKERPGGAGACPGWESDPGGGGQEAWKRLGRAQALALVSVAIVLAGSLAVVLMENMLGRTPGEEGVGAAGVSGRDAPAEPAPIRGEPPRAPAGPDGAAADFEVREALDEIAAAVGRFAASRNVDELLGAIRGGKAMEKRLREYYRNRSFAMPEVREVAPGGRVEVRGDLWSVELVLGDFRVQPIALERTEGGFLVDWESWVGYGEMAWEEFTKRQPTTSKRFRVRCAPADYYNHAFSDERKWRAFRVEPPGAGAPVYGYVPRYSELERRLAPLPGGEDEPQAFVVSLAYPDPPGPPAQVLIREVVTSGWVLAGAGREKK